MTTPKDTTKQEHEDSIEWRKFIKLGLSGEEADGAHLAADYIVKFMEEWARKHMESFGDSFAVFDLLRAVKKHLGK